MNTLLRNWTFVSCQFRVTRFDAYDTSGSLKEDNFSKKTYDAIEDNLILRLRALSQGGDGHRHSLLSPQCGMSYTLTLIRLQPKFCLIAVLIVITPVAYG